MRILAALWGLAGVFLLLGYAVWRLGHRAMEALTMESGLSVLQWIVLVVFAVFMLVAEGYRGFQQRFSPRTAARARWLRDQGKPVHAVLAPFFCMGYFHARRRTRITAICLTVGIILLVLLVSQLDQPWRGIIDFGVVLGLTWGIISLLIYSWQALTRAEFGHSPETPGTEPGAAPSPAEKLAEPS